MPQKSDREPAGSALDDARRRRREQCATLAALATAAAAVQPDAEAAISACGRGDGVPDEVALQLGRASRALAPIYQQAKYMDLDPVLFDARQELLRQLSYHLIMLRNAGDLVFSGLADERTARFRRELAEGLGPFARELPALADALNRSAAASPDADLVQSPPTGPPREFGSDEFVLDDLDL